MSLFCMNPICEFGDFHGFFVSRLEKLFENGLKIAQN